MDTQPLVEAPGTRIALRHDDAPGPQDHEVQSEALEGLPKSPFRKKSHPNPPSLQGACGLRGKAAGPGDGQVSVHDAKLTHEVHGSLREVSVHHLHAQLLHGGSHLGCSLRVGPEALSQEDRLRVDPHEIGTFEGPPAPHRTQHGDPQLPEGPGHPALFPGPDRRGRASHDGALRGHHHEVRHEHLVGRRKGRGGDLVYRHPFLPVRSSQLLVLVPAPQGVGSTAKKVGLRFLLHGFQLPAGWVEQDGPQSPPFGVDAAGGPMGPELLAEGGAPGLPPGSAVGWEVGEVGHGPAFLVIGLVSGW
jgi:hypothetical protein